MAESAHITSIEALDAFRAKIALFHSASTRALDDAVDGIRSTRSWLELEQRAKWAGELRKRQRRLAQAEQELYSARLADQESISAARKMEADRARAAVEEAEQKLERIKGWARELERVAAPLVKRIDELRGRVTEDMPKAAAYLKDAADALQAYSDTAPPAAAPPPPPPAAGDEGAGHGKGGAGGV